MGVYASTVALDTERGERLTRNFIMVMGTCDLTNYNTTGAEITDITKWFQTIKRVIADGVSDNGYLIKWDPTDKCFHAYYPRPAQAAVTTDKLTIVASGAANITDGQSVTVNAAFRSAVDVAAGTEVVNDVDVGMFNFVAFGLH